MAWSRGPGTEDSRPCGPPAQEPLVAARGCCLESHPLTARRSSLIPPQASPAGAPWDPVAPCISVEGDGLPRSSVRSVGFHAAAPSPVPEPSPGPHCAGAAPSRVSAAVDAPPSTSGLSLCPPALPYSVRESAPFCLRSPCLRVCPCPPDCEPLGVSPRPVFVPTPWCVPCLL